MIRKQGIAISKIVIFVLLAVLLMTSVQPVRVYAKSQDVTKSISNTEIKKMKNVIDKCFRMAASVRTDDYLFDGMEYWDDTNSRLGDKKNVWDFTKKEDIQQVFNWNISLSGTDNSSDNYKYDINKYDLFAKMAGVYYFSLDGNVYDSSEYTKLLFGKAVNIKDFEYENGEAGDVPHAYGILKKVVKESSNKYRVDVKYIYTGCSDDYMEGSRLKVHGGYLISYYLTKSAKSYYGYYLKKVKITKKLNVKEIISSTLNNFDW